MCSNGYFNPRPPWGGRQTRKASRVKRNRFQSTPSVGRATLEDYEYSVWKRFISIHALRGEGDYVYAAICHTGNKISIHALRGEGDTAGFISQTSRSHFNPRPPWGGRQIDYKDLGHYSIISIHALRGEGDCATKTSRLSMQLDFNPRPPWGGRPRLHSHDSKAWQNFNPRPPWGGRRTPTRRYLFAHHDFNPRPPWGGRRPQINRFCRNINYFNPRPPWGGRRSVFECPDYTEEFQSTPSVGRATKSTTSLAHPTENFNPRPPWGGRRSAIVIAECGD